MELNAWTKNLRSVYEKAISLYRAGNRSDATYFTEDEKTFLASIGLRPVNVYDFAEDFVTSAEPDWETFLLTASARRDFFLFEQKGASNPAEIPADELPPKDAMLEGIPWLPRIIQKGRFFLEGALCHDIMYCCGGDRHFLKEHGLHPADFLRTIWAARGDDQKILAFVRKAGQEQRP
jgi:uncharacterized protein DUF5069